MQPQDIEAELSYAYLHAVAAHAGIACQVASRSHDNLGIDATLSVRRDFGPGAPLTQLSLHIQLKATVKQAACRNGRRSYWLDDVQEYDRLRADTALPPRILGVLFLPENPAKWLIHSAEQLALCHCAYWACLVGAPESSNKTGQTIYLPEEQALSPSGLEALFGRLARREALRYAT